MWFKSSFEEGNRSPSSTLAHHTYSKTKTSQDRKSNKGKRRKRARNSPQTFEDVDEVDDNALFESKKSKYSLKDVYFSNLHPLLIDIFPPANTKDLVVHSKKIQEVKNWLSTAAIHKSPILLLTGPSGSGKKTTLKTLCREMNFNVIEWEANEQLDIFRNEEGIDVVHECPQLQTFTNFLKAANRCLLDSRYSGSIIFVEQLPNVFYRDPGLLHSVLREYSKDSKRCLVLALSSVESSWYLNLNRILSSKVLTEIGIETITFNSLAVTFVSKALKRVLEILNVPSKPQQIKSIAVNCRGDIRSAINQLEICIDANGDLSTEIIPYSGLSSGSDFFHCLGKLLYAKRSDEVTKSWSESESLLSSSISDIHRRPFPLKDDVNNLIDEAMLHCNDLSMYLFEHELNFVDSVNSLRKVYENMSLADCFFSREFSRGIEVAEDYKSEIAARSVIFYNFGYKSRGRGLYKFYKPKYFTVQKQAESFRYNNQLNLPTEWHSDFFPLTLPFLSKSSTKRDECQQNLMRTISSAVHNNLYFVETHFHDFWPGAKSANSICEDSFDIEEIDD